MQDGLMDEDEPMNADELTDEVDELTKAKKRMR